MKKTILSVSLILLLSVFSMLFAQGFQPPAAGKAVIYFTRVSNMSFAATFEYFDNDKFIGEGKGVNYIRYECDPGEHLFWIKGENVDYMTATLRDGGTYIVVIDVFFGGHPSFHPVNEQDKERFDLAKALVYNNPAVITPEKVYEKKKEKHAKLIPEKLKLYHEKYKNDPERNFKHIIPDLAIQPEALKK